MNVQLANANNAISTKALRNVVCKMSSLIDC